MRKLLTVLFISSCLTSCQYFGVNFTQGNHVSARQVRQLKLGLSEAEVLDRLGSPLYDNSFRKERWVYVYTRQTRDKIVKKRLLLDFKDGHLARISR